MRENDDAESGLATFEPTPTCVEVLQNSSESCWIDLSLKNKIDLNKIDTV